jgi:hypothetical protein
MHPLSAGEVVLCDDLEVDGTAICCADGDVLDEAELQL